MDITKAENKLFTHKYINGVTINYSVFFTLGTLIFIILKQILKNAFNLSGDISMGISFAVVMVGMFFAEKNFVFNHKQLSNLPKQILWYLFRTFVDLGFYKILDFVISKTISISGIITYIFSFALIFVFNYYFDKLLVFDDIQDEKKVMGGRIYKIFFENRFVLFSILIATVVISIVFLLSKLFPFGDMTVLRMDLYHQYGPLFGEFYDRVSHFESFGFSWRSGGGTSFLGNYFNYLSSPLSFLVFLFDRDQLGYAITMLVIVKGVLSAGTFTYFLKKSFDRHSYATAAFGVFYAFSGYFLAYYWNIMWIDGMILLPLIALGIENIINNGNGKLYIASLVIMFFSSYYIGYMTCIFSVLYFIVYFFSHYDFDSVLQKKTEKKKPLQKLLNRRFIANGLKFAFFSLISGAVCACFLVPVYFILQSCSATSDSFPKTFESYFDLFNLISSHIAGLETTIRSSGEDVLPNVYCGILPALLIPLYVVNKNIRLKEKAMYIVMLVIFVFSFDNNVMNFIWHAFHFPNDLPYRFSYMYSFILIVMAFRVLMNFKGIEYRDIGFAGILWLIVVLLIQKDPTNKISEPTIYTTLALIVIWTGVLYMIKKKSTSKLIIGVTIVAIVIYEGIVGGAQSYFFTQNQTDYMEDYKEVTECIESINNKDDDFYKTELTYLKTRMDPCLYGYDGMSIFSSMAYENYSQTQYSLGMFGNRINSFTYNTQTPVYNMMFNIKYLIEAPNTITPSTNYYEEFLNTKSGRTSVYKNKLYLPIAFTASNELKDWDDSEGDPFMVQEDLIDRAAGVGSVFEEVKYVSTNSGNTFCEEVTKNGTVCFSKEDGEEYTSIDITLESVNNSNMYVYISSNDIESVNYYRDDSNSTYQNINEPYIMDLGAFKKGEQITVSLDLNSVNANDSYFEIYAYNINNDILYSAYEMLNYGALKVKEHSDTAIKGEINAGFDGYLYTSIPYDEGWSIYIDGKKAKTFSIGTDSMLCTTIKHGKHNIELKYVPRGIKIGLATSAGAIILLAGYEIIKNKQRKRESSASSL